MGFGGAAHSLWSGTRRLSWRRRGPKTNKDWKLGRCALGSKKTVMDTIMSLNAKICFYVDGVVATATTVDAPSSPSVPV